MAELDTRTTRAVQADPVGAAMKETPMPAGRRQWGPEPAVQERLSAALAADVPAAGPSESPAQRKQLARECFSEMRTAAAKLQADYPGIDFPLVRHWRELQTELNRIKSGTSTDKESEIIRAIERFYPGSPKGVESAVSQALQKKVIAFALNSESIPTGGQALQSAAKLVIEIEKPLMAAEDSGAKDPIEAKYFLPLCGLAYQLEKAVKSAKDIPPEQEKALHDESTRFYGRSEGQRTYEDLLKKVQSK